MYSGQLCYNHCGGNMENKQLKATVDEAKCIGCGTCASMCGCFELKDGISHYQNGCETVCNLKEVAESCPVEAITVED
jgi:ferredoxin